MLKNLSTWFVPSSHVWEAFGLKRSSVEKLRPLTGKIVGYDWEKWFY